MAQSFDVIVIGAGPAGYVAAIRCAQLGLTTACIDDMRHNNRPSLGGTCLNVGCIPSKALLESSHHFHDAKHNFASHGISTTSLDMDVPTMQARKDEIVAKLTGGIQQIFKANGITSFHGHGRLLRNKMVTIVDPDSNDISDTLSAQNVILAPGSKPVELDHMRFDHHTVLDSNDVLALSEVPEKMVVVGAGVIGLELGSVWSRLGSEVTLLEAMDDFLPAADLNIARVAKQQFKKQGLKIELGAKVTSLETNPDDCTVHFEQKNTAKQIQADKVAVMVGRAPSTHNLLAADCGIETDTRGFIQVDDYCRAAVPGIWAIGDAVRGPMLAHKGSEEGVMVAELIAGQKPEALDLEQIPSVIYTHPEIAWVGASEKSLKDAGKDIKVGSFPFAASGRAQASGNTDGLIKVIADAKTDRILGVHMIGAQASELLAEAGFSMAYQASAEDIGRTIHAHPTLAEALKEAALSVHKEAIHKAG